MGLSVTEGKRSEEGRLMSCRSSTPTNAAPEMPTMEALPGQ